MVSSTTFAGDAGMTTDKLIERLRKEALERGGLHLYATPLGVLILEAADSLSAYAAREKQMREALENMATQKTVAEMTPELVPHADFEGAFDTMVKLARAALDTMQRERE